MNTRFAVIAFAFATAVAPAAVAGIQTHTIDFFPDEPTNIALQLRLFLPELTGRQIVETRLTLEFTPEPGFDAGAFYLLLAPPVDPDPGEDGFIFLDAFEDLGWSGQGTFRVERTFTALNGVLGSGLWGHDVFPTTDPPITVGRFSADSRWEIDTIEVPAPGAAGLVIAGLLTRAWRRRRSR